LTAESDETPLVAIGGLGGSGTRVAAQIVQGAGFHIGSVLNAAQDNLLFTLFFKRPEWITRFPEEAEITQSIGTFVSLLQHGLPPNQTDAAAMTEKISLLLGEFANHSANLGIAPEHRSALLNIQAPPVEQIAGLSWKEPNTHVFLPYLAKTLPELKYIHVIRNGLDMALGKNHGQFHNWRGLFPEQDFESGTLEQNRLKFWAVANEQALSVARDQMDGRFFLLRYEDLCLNTSEQIEALLAFLGRKATPGLVRKLARMVQPTSLGRFRKHPSDVFNDDDRRMVQRLGFSVD